jgi:hypothetical protein
MKKYQGYFSIMFIVGFTLILKPYNINAQQKESVDNGYYITYPDKLMLRIFTSQKFAPFTISSKAEQELNYKTNSKLNLGLGATYKSYTLNLSYGFKFLNKEKGRGTTKGLDLQFHIFPKKWAIDFLGTFRKGYYLDPKNNNGLNLSKYYLRPDFKRNIIGLSVFRVPNSGKFSYRAAITQNDWQTKSAGSLLYGAEIYYGNIKGDSALVPTAGNSLYLQAGINNINFISVGPGIGYAYTLVIDKNFFLTGSLIGNIDANFSTEETSVNKNHKVSVLPSGIYKGAIGYNSAKWSLTANITGNALYSGSAFTSKNYFLPTGNFRFILATKVQLK